MNCDPLYGVRQVAISNLLCQSVSSAWKMIKTCVVLRALLVAKHMYALCLSFFFKSDSVFLSSIFNHANQCEGVRVLPEN